MFMKNDAFDKELDKLVEGRMKELRRINQKEELEFKEISELTNPEGREVFGNRGSRVQTLK